MTPQLSARRPHKGGFLGRAGAFFLSPRNLYIIGFLLILALSLIEASRGRHRNFMIFAEATKLFWQQIAPYGANWPPAGMRLDYFLYGPLFNVLFAPFAYLPGLLGPVAWNLFNFTLWFAAIFTLPRFTREEKCKSFLYTFLILACTQLSFQYNVTVGCMFLFAYTLLERGRGFWAVVLIMLSGFTKVYGIFQLGLLVCYPRFWRNMGYAVLVGAVLWALPAVGTTPDGLPGWYGEWADALLSHKDTREWKNIFYLRPLNLLAVQPWVQAGVLAALTAGLFAVAAMAERLFPHRSAGLPDGLCHPVQQFERKPHLRYLADRLHDVVLDNEAGGGIEAPGPRAVLGRLRGGGSHARRCAVPAANHEFLLWSANQPVVAGHSLAALGVDRFRPDSPGVRSPIMQLRRCDG